MDFDVEIQDELNPFSPKLLRPWCFIEPLTETGILLNCMLYISDRVFPWSWSPLTQLDCWLASARDPSVCASRALQVQVCTISVCVLGLGTYILMLKGQALSQLSHLPLTPSDII